MVNLKDPNKRLLAVAVGSVVVALGVFGWLSWSDLQAIDGLHEEHETLRAKLAKAETEIRQIPGLEDEVLILRERVKEYVTILPDDSEVNRLVDDLSTFAGDSGVTVTVLDDTQAKQRKVRQSKTREAFDRITYKVKLTAGTEGFLKFLDSFENKYGRFVNIPTLKIKGGDETPTEGTAAEPASEIDMDLETYVYNPKTQGVDQVEIPKEDAKLERLRQSGKLDARSTDLALARFDYKPAPDRRDPFVDPRLTLAVNGKVSEEVRRAQLQALEDLKARLAKIDELVAREGKTPDPVQKIQLQGQTNALIRELDVLVTKYAADRFFTLPDYAHDFQDSIETPFRALFEKRGQLGDAITIGRKEIEDRVVAMEQALESGRYEKVVALSQDLAQLRSRVEGQEGMEGLFRRAGEVQRRASLHVEFASRAFAFGGCICYQGDPRQSVVIINEKSYGPGESVEDGLVILSINTTEVVFDFKGITVSRRHSGDGTP